MHGLAVGFCAFGLHRGGACCCCRLESRSDKTFKGGQGWPKNSAGPINFEESGSQTSASLHADRGHDIAPEPCGVCGGNLLLDNP